MIKKIIAVAMTMISSIGAFAQNPQVQPLPMNPDVKHGVLPNGLKYYILHNEEPKNRANFYIAQRVGSTLETKEQLGLAHFLEHMAFNGTKNYPGKDLLNYLQSKGIRFGADINAYTAFDETVYNINNVPTTDKLLVDSVLLAIRDWSGDILLKEDEINSERGVIEEEWRSRNNANSRMLEYVLPLAFQEYQYQQSPIGKMEVVKNFPPQAIRDYYKKWYRPDLQGVVIVGDIDAAEMEKKVKELFSSIPMPANAAERTYASVSDNKEPIYIYYEDKETNYPLVSLMFKSEPLPFELRNTLQGYVMSNVLQSIVASLINTRLSDNSQNPECTYAGAQVGFQDYLVAKTKDSFSVNYVPKDDVVAGMKEVMGIVARACKAGFTQSELDRTKAQILAAWEKRYNERNKTNTEGLSQKLIRHFIDNTPAMSIEQEYQIVKFILDQIDVNMLNEACKGIMTPENQVLLVNMPKKEGVAPIAANQLLPLVEDAINAQYEAFVDEVITEPLITKFAKPGKISKEMKGAYGSTEFVLSNGVKVIVKSTDYKADEIQMAAFRQGGKRSYSPAQAANIQLIEDAFESSKIGNFDRKKLAKYLSGKYVGLGFGMGNTTNEFTGSSNVKDLPYLMELIYAAFTQVTPDEQAYAATKEQTRTMLKNAEKNPNTIFKKHVANAQYAGNPMYAPVDMQVLEKADYNEMLKLYHEVVANAADYTFIFVGNIDLKTFKPLLEKYIASLPAKKVKKQAPKALSSIAMAEGDIVDSFKQPMSSPSTTVLNFFTGNNVPYSVKNGILFNLVGDILEIKLTESLREEMGGTYSPGAGAMLNPFTKQWAIIYQFVTNSDVLDKMVDRADNEFAKLLKEGASEKDFNKVKEASIKQLEIAERSNGYWMGNIKSRELGYDSGNKQMETLKSISLAELNDWMKNLYDGKNKIRVIMDGVKDSE